MRLQLALVFAAFLCAISVVTSAPTPPASERSEDSGGDVPANLQEEEPQQLESSPFQAEFPEQESSPFPNDQVRGYGAPFQSFYPPFLQFPNGVRASVSMVLEQDGYAYVYGFPIYAGQPTPIVRVYKVMEEYSQWPESWAQDAPMRAASDPSTSPLENEAELEVEKVEENDTMNGQETTEDSLAGLEDSPSGTTEYLSTFNSYAALATGSSEGEEQDEMEDASLFEEAPQSHETSYEPIRFGSFDEYDRSDLDEDQAVLKQETGAAEEAEEDQKLGPEADSEEFQLYDAKYPAISAEQDEVQEAVKEVGILQDFDSEKAEVEPAQPILLQPTSLKERERRRKLKKKENRLKKLGLLPQADKEASMVVVDASIVEEGTRNVATLEGMQGDNKDELGVEERDTKEQMLEEKSLESKHEAPLSAASETVHELAGKPTPISPPSKKNPLKPDHKSLLNVKSVLEMAETLEFKTDEELQQDAYQLLQVYYESVQRVREYLSALDEAEDSLFDVIDDPAMNPISTGNRRADKQVMRKLRKKLLPRLGRLKNICDKMDGFVVRNHKVMVAFIHGLEKSSDMNLDVAKKALALGDVIMQRWSHAVKLYLHVESKL